MSEIAANRKKHRPASLDLKGSNLNVGDATKDMKEYALKCVSPGLPPLSTNMKTTVKISNSIAAQQRAIIQSRKSDNEIIDQDNDQTQDQDQDMDGDQDGDHDQDHDQDLYDDQPDNSDDNVSQDKTNNEANDNDTPSSTTSTTTTTTNTTNESNDKEKEKESLKNDRPEDSSILNAQTQKRLKRDKAPPPLNFSFGQNKISPSIKSAPIYNFTPQFNLQVPQRQQLQQSQVQFKRRIPISSRTQQFPSNIIMTPNGPARLIQTPQIQFAKRQPITQQQHQQQHHHQQQQQQQQHQQQQQFAQGSYPSQHLIPQSASTYRNINPRSALPLTQQQSIKYQQQLAYQQEQWAKFKDYRDSKKGNHVTDVFEGDATRLAPVTSQPLSAQREFFNLDSSKNVNKVQNLSSINKTKSNNNSDDCEIIDESDEEDLETYSNEENKEKENDEFEEEFIPIRTELRISDKIFRFELKNNGKLDENDKTRFLNHCAGAWEKFANSLE